MIVTLTMLRPKHTLSKAAFYFCSGAQCILVSRKVYSFSGHISEHSGSFQCSYSCVFMALLMISGMHG